MKSPRGKIITLEGLEASGKDTQIALIARFLTRAGIKFTVAREPGGTLTGEMLRAILKHPSMTALIMAKALKGHSDFALAMAGNWATQPETRTPESETFMFFAARAEFAHKVLKPAVANGMSVICNRLHDSTRAYQGGGRFYNQPQTLAWIKQNNLVALGGLMPDLTLFLDIEIETMIGRIQKDHPEKQAFFERTCDTGFWRRTRAAYLAIAQEEPQRFMVINGEQSPAEVFAQIKMLLIGALHLED